MTKYILHGGATGIQNQNNKEFFQTAAELNKDTVSIVILYPHIEPENIEQKFTKHTSLFEKYNPQTNYIFNKVSENPEKAKGLIASSDIVFVPGGNTFLIMDFLREIPDFDLLLECKVYMGSSGGAYALCEYFYENAYPGVYKGLGILPFKIIGHFGSSFAGSTGEDWNERIELLKNKGENERILALEETEFYEYQVD